MSSYQGYNTGFKFDQSLYKKDLQQSMGPLQYVLNTNSIKNNHSCSDPFGSYILTDTTSNVTPKLSLTDLESILTNRNAFYSDSDHSRTNPLLTQDIANQYAYQYKECPFSLEPIQSRLTDPAKNYRGIGPNRFYNVMT